MVSLKMQKRLAASVLNCGHRKASSLLLLQRCCPSSLPYTQVAAPLKARQEC